MEFLRFNKKKKSIHLYYTITLFHLFTILHKSNSQQAYVNNKQLDCYNHYNATDGFLCNGPSKSCTSYLTFRSNPPTYDTAISIGYLLNSDPSQIASINEITDVEKIPQNTLLIVPVNCSCSGRFYQRNASYALKSTDETYFTVANNTYQALTTCQAMIAMNNQYDSRNLSVNLNLVVPLMCACPSYNQVANGVKYLLTYLVAMGESLSSIAEMFQIDEQSLRDANELTADGLVYYFTPLVVPLKTVPSKINIVNSPPPPPASPPPPSDNGGDSGSSKKWVYVGVGIGAALLVALICGVLLFCFCCRSKKRQPVDKKVEEQPVNYSTVAHENELWSISTIGIQSVIESLTEYRYEELEKATEGFSEGNRINGSNVYKGSFKGDSAAIKKMKGGDVFREIKILKQLNHSNIIRLSGYCIHKGIAYLVYEYAENGSLYDWLHFSEDKKLDESYSSFSSGYYLGWKQRVQIAYDVSDALNYIHNYSNPPCVHKNLKSSNILLDSNLRGKVANFGLARSIGEKEDDEVSGMQLTRHVVGTQGYMAPEYIENGVITPKLDVFAFGVLLLELLSGKEAVNSSSKSKGEDELLFASIKMVLEGENVREKLIKFMDPSIKQEYPLDMAFSLAQLANNCVRHDLNSRPAMSEVHMTLSKILSSSLDWDPSDDLGNSSRSL